MTLHIKADTRNEDETILFAYDGERCIGRIASLSHPDWDWDALAALASAIPAAIYDAMQEFPAPEGK